MVVGSKPWNRTLEAWWRPVVWARGRDGQWHVATATYQASADTVCGKHWFPSDAFVAAEKNAEDRLVCDTTGEVRPRFCEDCRRNL